MLDKHFRLRKKGSNIKTEIIAGATTFLTMAYIIFVNPAILSDAGMDKSAVIAVTCIVSAIATIGVGLFANAPIAMAPGMGLNAFFAYSLVIGGKANWQTALGVVFLSGVFFLVLTVIGLRKKLVEAIPAELIAGISVGIGLFITFIGLVNMGVVVKNDATLVAAGKFTPTVMIGLSGLLVMIILEMKKVKGSLLIGIAAATGVALAMGKVAWPKEPGSFDFNISAVFFQLDIAGAIKWSMFGAIFSLMFMDMFDSVGTLVACCHQADMVNEDKSIKGLDRLLGIDALATMVGALFGTSTTTAYLESASGIEQGGRSGLTAIVTGLLFLVSLLFVPLVGIVPGYATAPALIMVGLFMMKEIKHINFGNIEQGFPSFIIMVMIALSYSISTGLAFGFVSFVIIKTAAGKVRDVKPAMWIVAALSLMFLGLDWVSEFVSNFSNAG